MNTADYYDILDISRYATTYEIVQAYRLAMETYASGSQAAFSMFDDDQLQDIFADIERAYQTLSQIDKRRAYG